MEIPIPTIVLSIPFVTILAAAWWVLNWVWFKPKKLERYLRQQGLSGKPYRILFGDFKEMAVMMKKAKSKPIHLEDDIVPRVSPFFYQMIKNYGKNPFIWFGPKPTILIMGPENLKEVFNKFHDFPKPHANPLVQVLTTGLIDHKGEKWAKHRKIINPAFHPDKLKLMLPAFYQSCSEMIKKWEKLVSGDGDGSSSELDVWPYLQNLASDVISRTSFGSNYEEGKRIFQLQSELGTVIMEVIRSLYIPGWRFLPTKTNRRIKDLDKRIRDSLKVIISKREKEMKEGETKSTNDDLLGILMRSNLQEIQENGNDKNAGMSIEDVIGECKLFYFAGQETTSVLLVWTMILLSKHSEWQARAREEVLQVFGKNKPEFSGLNHLKIVTMILYEVLRLYPSVPALTRIVNKRMKLGNLILPAGVLLTLPIILVHQDHQLWGEDASEFKPERFSEGVSKATKNKVCFFPFGWGPRICIGQNFAMIEAKLALSMMLQNFAFELSQSYDHAPHIVITVRPQHGAQLLLRKL